MAELVPCRLARMQIKSTPEYAMTLQTIKTTLLEAFVDVVGFLTRYAWVSEVQSFVGTWSDSSMEEWRGKMENVFPMQAVSD